MFTTRHNPPASDDSRMFLLTFEIDAIVYSLGCGNAIIRHLQEPRFVSGTSFQLLHRLMSLSPF
jgi:hypothetical protein